METGKTIATLREAKDWSQTDLANNSKVSRIMTGIYERDEGQNVKFDKKTVQRLQDIEALKPRINYSF